jgi:hypothetical protein
VHLADATRIGQEISEQLDIIPPKAQVLQHVRSKDGVVTLSETSQILAIEQQAKSLKFHGSAYAVVGNLRSI